MTKKHINYLGCVTLRENNSTFTAVYVDNDDTKRPSYYVIAIKSLSGVVGQYLEVAQSVSRAELIKIHDLIGNAIAESEPKQQSMDLFGESCLPQLQIDTDRDSVK